MRALTRGLSDLPKADAVLRAELDCASLEELQRRYTAFDPEGATRIDLKNKRRLVRAIEVCILTKKPFSSFRDAWETPPEKLRAFLLTRDRDDLHERINRRVMEMFRNGAVEEVRRLTDAGPTASRAIGFGEIRALFSGELTESECIARVQQATRRYAKRQLTWFRREPGFKIINVPSDSDLKSVVQLISKEAAQI
jgi:tRNA dimethylallyltransferase